MRCMGEGVMAVDFREKLADMLFAEVYSGGIICDGDTYKQVRDGFVKIADHLIAHGVTVQEYGHWEDDHGDYVCSCCHTVFTDEIVWLVRGESNEPNYCPKCGAKMKPQPPKGE